MRSIVATTERGSEISITARSLGNVVVYRAMKLPRLSPPHSARQLAAPLDMQPSPRPSTADDSLFRVPKAFRFRLEVTIRFSKLLFLFFF